MRARREAYRPGKPRRSDAMAELEREVRGEPTLRALRGGLPSWKEIRSQLTHEDGSGRGYLVGDDTFGIVLRKPTQPPPENGEMVHLRPLQKEGEQLTYTLFNIEQVGRRVSTLIASRNLHARRQEAEGRQRAAHPHGAGVPQQRRRGVHRGWPRRVVCRPRVRG